MTQHYFLNAFLPPLSLDADVEVDIAALKDLVEINGNLEENHQLRLFLTFADLHNLNALWNGQPTVVEGNLTRDELKLWQDSPLETPVFIEQFIRKWKSNEERVRHFDELVLAFFGFAEERGEGFLKEWLAFEQALQVGLAARRVQALHRSGDEFTSLDPLDPWQSELLAIANQGPDISGLQESLSQAFDLYTSLNEQPVELFRQLLLFRFDRIDKMVRPYSQFSFDRVIAYAAQVQIMQRWKAAKRKGLV